MIEWEHLESQEGQGSGFSGSYLKCSNFACLMDEVTFILKLYQLGGDLDFLKLWLGKFYG
jgi:hypothetical protein